MNRTPVSGGAHPRNCAVRQYTADGVPSGRCWRYLRRDGVCPRHGDVSEVQRRYLETGELTDERQHDGG